MLHALFFSIKKKRKQNGKNIKLGKRESWDRKMDFTWVNVIHANFVQFVKITTLTKVNKDLRYETKILLCL